MREVESIFRVTGDGLPGTVATNLGQQYKRVCVLKKLGKDKE